MIVIYLLIPLSILIAACFLVAFIWAVRSGQYEDTHTPSMRMLWEDQGPAIKKVAPHAVAPSPVLGAPRDEKTRAIDAWPKPETD